MCRKEVQLEQSIGFPFQIVFFFQVGGRDEYEICDALKTGRITKPVVAWCIGTCANMFTSEVKYHLRSSIGLLVSQSIGRSVSQSVGQSVCWSIGLLVSRSVGQSVGMVYWSVGRSIGPFVCLFSIIILLV